MITIDNFNFSKQRALIRVDFNVPLDKQYHITDDSRIRGAIPTIKKILADGGSVVLMSHLGRPAPLPPKGGGTPDQSLIREKFSLKHIVNPLSALLALPPLGGGGAVKFASDCISDDAFTLSKNLKPGEVLLLENLRFYKEEEKGDEGFAKKLSAHGDIYVNDAFGTAHRAHASTAVIAKFFPGKKCFGYLMARELENANKVISHAQHPFTAIMGGAKVSDKILIIENLISKADNILIGGGMAYTFFKAKGGSIGNSLVEEDKLHLALEIIDKAKARGCNLLLPIDSKIANCELPISDLKSAIDNSKSEIKEVDSNNIPPGWMGLDIGSKAISAFTEVIEKSKTILWNGPMGVFEIQQFENGTRKVAEAIANATSKGAYSLIGGGDSAAAIHQFGLADKVSYVSTGGGALLEYFEGKVLPGVKAIQD